MQCPICGKDVELQKKQVGVDEQGTPVFNQYAVCRDCKKQWNLDKQRAKKAASPSAAGSGGSSASAQREVQKETAVKKAAPVKRAPAKGEQPVRQSSPKETAEQKSRTGKTVDEKEGIRRADSERGAMPKSAPGKAAEEKAGTRGTLRPSAQKEIPRREESENPNQEVSSKAGAGGPAAGREAARRVRNSQTGKGPVHREGAAQAEREAARREGTVQAERAARREEAVQMEREAARRSGADPAGKETVRRKGAAQAEKDMARRNNGDRKAEREAVGRNRTENGVSEARRESTGNSEREPQRKPGNGTPQAEQERGRRNPSGKPVSREGTRGTVPGRAPEEKRPVHRPVPEGSAEDREPARKQGAAVRRAQGKNGVIRNMPVKEEDAEQMQKKSSDTEDASQQYGNIPPEQVRVKRERAVRKGYEDMLSTDPEHKPSGRKGRDPEEEDEEEERKRPAPEKKRPRTKEEDEDEYEEEEDYAEDEEYDDYDEPVAKFRIIRIVFGILSLAAFGFFLYRGFFTGLDNIAAGIKSPAGTTYIVFAICMLVSGLLLLILNNRNTILAFVLPMAFYFGGAVYSFLKRGDDTLLLYSAIAGAVLGIVFLVLGVISSNQDDYDDSQDYDDPYGDDYE